MLPVALDTSYLISFADPARPHHATAVEYFRRCLAERIPMLIPTLAVAEFEVGQPITDLPMQNFGMLPFNMPHARRAGRFAAALRAGTVQVEAGDVRHVVRNDLNVLAQASEEGLRVVLTEDANTLSRMAARLRAAELSMVWAVLLSEGFKPERLQTPEV